MNEFIISFSIFKNLDVLHDSDLLKEYRKELTLI